MFFTAHGQPVELCQDESCCSACCVEADSLFEELFDNTAFALNNACLRACENEIEKDACSFLTLPGFEDDVVQQSCFAGFAFKDVTLKVFEFNADGNQA